MSEEFEIRNKVAESGLVNFDLSTLVPKGIRKGIDLKDFLFQELILKEKDFREKVDAINTEEYKDAYIYIYNSVDTIIPLWAYFVLTAKLTDVAKKIVFGDREDLEVILMHNAIQTYDFEDMRGKRVLVKGCSDKEIPENAYIELVEQLKPLVKSLMFGEACSNVPIVKN
jgi:Fe-S cluster assembly scaffold protein SufB